jgi:peptidoglycan/LPS O-acetylase OafA/YrhL
MSIIAWLEQLTREHNVSDGNTTKMNKSARVLIVILIAGLVAGVAGVVEHGWQHPGDTIGTAVWLLLAMLFVLAILHKSPGRP